MKDAAPGVDGPHIVRAGPAEPNRIPCSAKGEQNSRPSSSMIAGVKNASGCRSIYVIRRSSPDVLNRIRQAQPTHLLFPGHAMVGAVEDPAQGAGRINFVVDAPDAKYVKISFRQRQLSPGLSIRRMQDGSIVTANEDVHIGVFPFDAITVCLLPPNRLQSPVHPRRLGDDMTSAVV